MTRCKFKCESVTFYSSVADIKLVPVTNGSSEENKRFFKYTPAGEFNLSVVSKETAKQFIPDQEYYIDITPCE